MIEVTTLDFHSPIKADAEDLDIEFKLMLPLKDNLGKAKLAKEICALSNHGGGWIVLGRENDGKYPQNLPIELSGEDQDTINQIASAYLQPAPHCAVRWVRPSGIAFDVLVIWVSAVGTSPVCGLKNGPNDGSGKTVGVKKGVHYVRKAGPVSAPIESPDEWQTVIRRCVLNDKTALLGALTTMIQQPRQTPEAKQPSALDCDFDHVIGSWKEKAKNSSYEVNLEENFICLGFELVGTTKVTLNKIKECLQNRPYENFSGHSFYSSKNSEIQKIIVIESNGVDGLEFYSTDEQEDFRFAWRLSEALSGVEVFSYWEDTAWIKSAVEQKSSATWERGKHIWIKQQISYIHNFLAMVAHFAEYFKHENDIRVRAQYSGLRGRSLRSPNPSTYYSKTYEAHQNTRLIDFIVQKKALEPETRSAAIVAIIQPINKLTLGPEITTEGVIHALKTNQ